MQIPSNIPPWATTALSILAVLLAGGSLTVTLSDSGGSGEPHQISFTVNGGKDGQPTETVKVPAAAVAQAQPVLENGLKNEAPAGTTQAQVEDIHRAEQQIRDSQPALPTAGATQGIPGCRTQFVVNQSSRRGVRPQQHWLHYTVSGNRAGWGDVNAIVALFNRPSFQASSNFVIDGEGHCAYIVPIENKSWAQAGSNSFAVSYEIINSGRESTYIAPAGLAKLRSVMRVVSARTGIPMRRGRVSNCTPARSGIVNHRDGGLCSGGHVDISPYSVDAVVRQLVAGGRKPASAHANALCRELAHYKREVKAHTFPESKRARANAVRTALVKAHYRCTVKGRAVRK